MKVMTIMGTRPDIIRLSQIIPKLDKYFNHVLVYTGQNFDKNLRDVFFDELGVRKPDYELNKEQKSGFDFFSILFRDMPQIIEKEKPDAVLILGDVNSTLSSYVVKRMGIPLFHMEAGNRCYSDEVPEEINRRIVDTLSDFLLPYTQRSREQLLIEGYHPKKIIVTGNPITEVIKAYEDKIDASNILLRLRLEKRKFVAVTFHRQENVDNKERLIKIINSLKAISKDYKVVVSTHPKTQERLREIGEVGNDNILFLEPLGFFDWVKLEKNAACAVSDSGTVQEECALFGTPCILIRTSTERPELLDAGSVVVSGIETEDIISSFKIAINSKGWDIPKDYESINVSDKIVKILMRYVNVGGER
ncbi:non-hydrolyzing UDP-N-acetylglucosamine 2-epimerase [Nanoarchaeota archaeon]